MTAQGIPGEAGIGEFRGQRRAATRSKGVRYAILFHRALSVRRLRLRADPLGVGGCGGRVVGDEAEAEARRQAGRGGLGAVDPAAACGSCFRGRTPTARGDRRASTRPEEVYAPVPDAHLAFRAAVTALCVSALIEAAAGGPEIGSGRRSRRSVALAAFAFRSPRRRPTRSTTTGPTPTPSKPWPGSPSAMPATRTAAASSAT